LLVDADTVLPLPPTAELSQPIARRHSKVGDLLSRIEDHQPAKRETLDHRPKFPDSLPLEETFRVAVPEALDHRK